MSGDVWSGRREFSALPFIRIYDGEAGQKSVGLPPRLRKLGQEVRNEYRRVEVALAMVSGSWFEVAAVDAVVHGDHPGVWLAWTYFRFLQYPH